MNGYSIRVPVNRQPPWEELIRQQIEQTQALKEKSKQLQRNQQIRPIRPEMTTSAPVASSTPTMSGRMRAVKPTSAPRSTPPATAAATSKMAAHLVCLTAAGGVPLFQRRIGHVNSLPFPLIGSLNGVNMFANSKDVTLLSTNTTDSQVVWKVFDDSIVLILITNEHMNRKYGVNLLQNVFDTMVLLVGLEDLTRIKNVERLKKDLRCCFRLIDTLLNPQNEFALFGQLTRSVDCLLTPHHQVLQNHLEAFVEGMGTMYGCLWIHGRLVVATKKWWTLSECEAALLAVFISSCSNMTIRDVPVFLPVESPSVPHRLVTFCLLPGVEVCILCGPTPSVAEMERDVCKYWKNCLDALKFTCSLFPRNLSRNSELDKNILAFLLINTETNRCLCSLHSTIDSKTLQSKQRQEILRSFYECVNSRFFIDLTQDMYKVFHTRLKHVAVASYVCAKNFKCFSLREGNYKLFILFHSEIPIYALRSTSQKTLNLLLKDKNIRF